MSLGEIICKKAIYLNYRSRVIALDIRADRTLTVQQMNVGHKMQCTKGLQMAYAVGTNKTLPFE